MRIRDWSSDLCSSDLPGRQRFVRDLDEDERAGAALLFGDRRDARASFDRGTDGQGVQEFDLARRPHAARQRDRRQVAVGACLAAGMAVGARSEEHTSELQSLMRISYAVFCLNK